MAKEINVLVVEPGKAPRPAKVKNTLETFSEIVGGPVEAGCYLPQRVMLICQENGKQRGLPPNRANPRAGNYIAGTFLLCGFEDDSFISLPRPSRWSSRNTSPSPASSCWWARRPCAPPPASWPEQPASCGHI